MKKFITVALAILLMAAVLCGCMNRNKNNASSNISGNSSLNSGGNNSSVISSASSGGEISGGTSGIENNNSGGLISKIEEMLYDINPFRSAYEKAGFDIEEGTDSNNIRVRKGENNAYYEIYRFSSADEAQSRVESFKQNNREVERRGNIIIVYEKGNEYHNDYMEPFRSVE